MATKISASKQKRLDAKLAKASKSGTPAASSAGTPSISANGSFVDVQDAQAAMRKLAVATDRSAVSIFKAIGRKKDDFSNIRARKWSN